MLPAAVSARNEFRCGVDFLLTCDPGSLPAEGLRPAEPVAPGQKNATIVLTPGAGLAANPDALSAWESAVAIWERRLRDPVSLVIVGDMQPLSAGVLGSTSTRTFTGEFASVRNGMVTDASEDEAIVLELPTLAQLQLTMAPGFSFDSKLGATKANLKALGFDMSFDAGVPDATILFNSNLVDHFDFDPRDGIAAGKLDFEAVVVHEIGHVLGFISQVDYVDTQRSQGHGGVVRPSPLDLFRLLPGEGDSDFTGASRLMTTGDLVAVHVMHDGTSDLALSTGVELGDGNQASHWKADEQSGVYLGIMDPSLSTGVREVLTDNDMRAFGLIGWDVAAALPVEPLPDDTDLPPDPVVGYGLVQVYPNPFNPTANITYSVPASTFVRLRIHDLRGRTVRSLVNEYRPAGQHQVQWEGKNDRGQPVSSGVYLVQLESRLGVRQQRIVLLK